MSDLTNKEKINNIIVYLLFAEAELKNNLIDKEHYMKLHTDTFSVLEHYKAKCKYEVFEKLSSDIEKIIFDFL